MYKVKYLKYQKVSDELSLINKRAENFLDGYNKYISERVIENFHYSRG